MPSPVAKPVGQVTRGTTGHNRLRRFDRWIGHLAGPALSRREAPLVVDLGFGVHPATTVQWQRSLAPGTRVVGVEIDRERVAAAQGVIEAVHGGFEVPTDEPPVVIRAANVLRQYPVEEVAGAWELMTSRLTQDGWLVEGTCDELGRLATMISIDASAEPTWFTISCRLAGLAHPSDVAARLPKALIHRNTPGTAIHALLRDMDRAWESAARWGARQRWMQMAATLAESWEAPVDRTRWRLGEFTVPWRVVAE